MAGGGGGGREKELVQKKKKNGRRFDGEKGGGGGVRGPRREGRRRGNGRAARGNSVVQREAARPRRAPRVGRRWRPRRARLHKKMSTRSGASRVGGRPGNVRPKPETTWPPLPPPPRPCARHGGSAGGSREGGRGGAPGVLWPPRHPPRVQAGGDGRPILGGSGPAGQDPEERAVCPSHSHWTIEITVADPPRWMAGDRRGRRRHASSRATPFPPALCRPTGAAPARGSPLGVCRQKYMLERGRGPTTAARRLSFGRALNSLWATAVCSAPRFSLVSMVSVRPRRLHRRCRPHQRSQRGGCP